MDLEKIGRSIAEQRKFVKRISQEKMAEDLGMYQADVSALEHGRKGSGISDLNKLQTVADYLEIPLQELLFGSGKEGRLEHYDSKKMEIKWAGEKAKFPVKNRKMLACYYGIEEEQAQPLIFYCGKYVIYALRENQTMIQGGKQPFGFAKLHLMVLFENSVIGTLDADYLPLMYFVHQPSFQRLQSMIDFDVLDVADVLRTINPYIPLMQFAKGASRKKYEEMLYRRMEALMALRDLENVILVENLYVLEECRRKGVASMLLDGVRQMLKTETFFLNLEPLDYDNFLCAEYGKAISPLYSKEDISTISLNAGIAERLGFTVDPDGWYRQMADITDPSHCIIRTVSLRKTAYCLSPALQALLENDGDLVQQGRAMQLMAQAGENPSVSGTWEFQYRKLEKGILVQMGAGDACLLGYLNKDYEVRLAAATGNPLGEKAVDLSKYHWIDIENIERNELVDMMEVVLAHLEKTRS